MGEQLVLPKMAEFQPLTDDQLREKIDELVIVSNEITNNLNNPEGLIRESQLELYASLADVDRELEGLLDTATCRGLVGESILEEVA